MKERGVRGPQEQSTKPFTPFSIEDILSQPNGGLTSPSLRTKGGAPHSSAPLRTKGGVPHPISPLRTTGGAPHSSSPLRTTGGAPHSSSPLRTTGGAPHPLSPLRTTGGAPHSSSPLCALQELASKTFHSLEAGVLRAAEGHDSIGSFGHQTNSKKRRKSRTAFTNQQIYELEKRFLYQKYLSPADRDHMAQLLGLSNAQVITWFQNRRAKLKRDLEEMKADVESLKTLPPQALHKLVSMSDDGAAEEDSGPRSPTSHRLIVHSHHCPTMEHTVQEFSEEEEIEVDN
ncbi:transcription factor LBX2 [Engystomops pustulosus]|uniref:transcription factor LBX2 n=1 Tax=Engystomops pustulosus TaxID=76066 RepID=UPI003AFB39A0